MASLDSFKTRSTLGVGGRTYQIFRLDALDKAGVGNVGRLPFSLRILLENLLRNEDDLTVTAADIAALAGWDATAPVEREVAFRPARVLMQDLTGVPAIVDLAAMRDAMVELGGDPTKINPLQPAELVIDHSVQVDEFASPTAFLHNAALELERNRERYSLLRWGQQALANFKVVPPDTGIVHQVNLERLARVVFEAEDGDATVAYPDTVIGTDSHTTMINGLGVLGWGVGGIEAEASMLGQPSRCSLPEVVGFRLTGQLREGGDGDGPRPHGDADAPQAGRRRQVRRVLRPRPRSRALPLDRATIANMAPEYGATSASSRSTPRPSTTSASPADRGAGRSSSRLTARSRASSASDASPEACLLTTASPSTCATSCRASPGRGARRTACP